MGGGDVIQRRMIAAGLFVVGAYIYGLGFMVAFPSVTATAIMLFDRLFVSSVDPAGRVDSILVAMAVSVFYLCTCLSGLCGIVGSGGLWWNGSPVVIRVLVISGALGAIAQSVPTVGVLVGWMVLDPPSNPALLIAAILAVLPTLLFAVLAVAALLVLGGPPRSTSP